MLHSKAFCYTLVEQLFKPNEGINGMFFNCFLKLTKSPITFSEH